MATSGKIQHLGLCSKRTGNLYDNCLEISLLSVPGECPATNPVKQTSVYHCPQQMAGSGMDVALWITCEWYIRWWKELQYTGPLSVIHLSKVYNSVNGQARHSTSLACMGVEKRTCTYRSHWGASGSFEFFLLSSSTVMQLVIICSAMYICMFTHCGTITFSTTQSEVFPLVLPSCSSPKLSRQSAMFCHPLQCCVHPLAICQGPLEVPSHSHWGGS